MTADTSTELLSPDFLDRIERLDIASRKVFVGRMKGERRSKRKGQSVEFADYRNYVAGDDLRFLDWNIYGRLDKLFIKLFFEEEDLHVSTIVDCSGSMNFGDPSKSLYARRVAAAIGYIALAGYNRVTCAAFTDRYGPEMTGLRGRRAAHQLLGHLKSVEAAGAGHFSEACRQFAIRHPQRGVVVLISDFLDKGGYEAGLRYLIGRQYDLYVIQVLAPQEMNPPLTGDLALVDMEDEALADITVTRALINRYKHNLEAWCRGLQEFCTRRGAVHLFTSTEVPFDQLVMTYLRQRGLLK